MGPVKEVELWGLEQTGPHNSAETPSQQQENVILITDIGAGHVLFHRNVTACGVGVSTVLSNILQYSGCCISLYRSNFHVQFFCVSKNMYTQKTVDPSFEFRE